MQTTIVLVEWLATFFLAVEAIKLHNLSALRVRLHQGIKWINPRITFVDKTEKDDSVLLAAYYFGFVLMGALISFFALSWLNWWSAVLTPFFSASTLVKIFLILGGGFLAIQLFAVIGSLLFMLIERVLRILISTLLVVEQNTASGIVGIIGFLLFSVAAAIKLYEH